MVVPGESGRMSTIIGNRKNLHHSGTTREQFARVLEKQPEGCPLVADTGQAQDPGHGASQGRISGDHWCTRPGIDS